MAKSHFFDGEENIAPRTAADARKLIGKKVKYLRDEDIDRTGRGYFFPRVGIVAGVHGRQIAMDYLENYCVDLSSLREMTLLPPDPESQPGEPDSLDEPQGASKKPSRGPRE